MAKLRHVGVRVGTMAYDFLRRQAEANGLTLSEYARRMLFLEIPHLAAFDQVEQVFEVARQEKDPKVGVALLKQAHQVVKDAKQALLESKDFRRALGEARYETALRELDAADHDIAERIAQIRGVVEMVTTANKLGGMQA